MQDILKTQPFRLVFNAIQIVLHAQIALKNVQPVLLDITDILANIVNHFVHIHMLEIQ